MKQMKKPDGQPYKETYLYEIQRQLSGIFRYAVRFYGLAPNPCEIAGWMGEAQAGEMQIITAEQYKVLRQEVRSERYRLAFDILFWTGCRKGECLALRPMDLSDDNMLRIHRTYHRKNSTDRFGPTKNSKRKGNRTIPISPWLADEIRTYSSRLYGMQEDDRLIDVTLTALNKELDRATAATGLPRIRVHDLRHSHAALCIELGYSMQLVAERLGDSLETVMGTYSHLYPNKQIELIDRLDSVALKNP